MKMRLEVIGFRLGPKEKEMEDVENPRYWSCEDEE